MGTSFPRNSQSIAGASAASASTEPQPGPSTYKKFLYRTLGWGVILALIAPAVLMTAQEDRPQITTREKSKVKKDNAPRALGLLRLNSSGKATLVPIAILVNGKFYDASAYKADPVPMALEPGTVYEAERSGDSQGLFTLNGALHSKDPGSQNPWVGSGSYLANGTEPPKHGQKAENVPVGIEKDEGPPRLTKADKPKPAETPSERAPSSTSPGTSESQPPQQNTPASPDKPAGQTPDQTAPQTANDQGKQPASQSQDNSYRPTLRRGKPTQPLPDNDETVTKAAPKTADGKTAPPAPSSGAVQLIPAISDAGGPDPRSYKFEWRKGEEGDRREQMLALAKDEFRVYLNKQAKATITSKPAAPKAAAPARKPAKQPQPVLENVQFHAFDVWTNNEPVMVLSAEANAPAPAGMAIAPADLIHYTIVLVARTDIYSNLHKLYLGITDKYHLDLTPQLELIDVVDADGDGRGELLFHETTDAGSGYVIYRATADTLWRMFDSLHPE